MEWWELCSQLLLLWPWLIKAQSKMAFCPQCSSRIDLWGLDFCVSLCLHFYVPHIWGVWDMQVERVRSALPVTKKDNSSNSLGSVKMAAGQRIMTEFFIVNYHIRIMQTGSYLLPEGEKKNVFCVTQRPEKFKHCVKKKKKKKKNLLFRRHDMGCSPPCSQMVTLNLPC